jgi:AAHS family 4-hydroxybenzoate transporter-like MFS transporter
MRSTGVGWALGIGRAGSIVGPVVGGLLVGMGLALEALFAVAAVPAVIAGLAVMLLSTLRAARASREPVPRSNVQGALE